MSAFACCFWWFLLGLLLGWLLNWLLQKFMGKDGSSNSGSGGNSYNGSAHASNAYSGSSAGSTSTSTSGSVGAGTLGAAAAGATAANLMSAGADKALALAAGFRIKGNHDLEIIEGIGPKIAGLFTEHGAGTFDKVMKMSVPEMLAILEKGGPRFKLANPGSWAQQAKLCYENRWAELQTLQDSLSAGVDKSDNSNA